MLATILAISLSRFKVVWAETIQMNVLIFFNVHKFNQNLKHIH